MKAGRVYITGAGPGDERLITVRAMELIREADVIVYDRLGAQIFLHYAKEGCELLDAGKGPQHHTMKQEDINCTLVEKAREGKKVLRLKGGDPFLFGRGGEEAESLYEAGIPFEIVPGVSSFYSTCAYGGIPVTHREYASSVHVFTGHREENRDLEDYEVIAKCKGTLVFLMGMKNLESICANLIAHGKNPKTPVAIIQWGTTYKQKEAEGTLATIVSVVKERKIGHPAVVVIGDVVAAKNKIEWQKYRPLWGKHVLLTGSGSSVEEAKAYLQEEGAEVAVFSAMEIGKPEDYTEFDEGLKKIETYSWIFFTSVRAVDAFFERMAWNKIDVRALFHCKIFCIGEKTKMAIEQRGLFVDKMPKKYNSIAAAQEMGDFLSKGDNIFFPASELAEDVLEKKALEIGAEFTRVTAYTNHIPQITNDGLLSDLKEEKFHAVGFFSSSQVRHIWKMTEGVPENCLLCSIGPSTTRTIEEFQRKAAEESEISTALGLAKAIEKALKR